MTEFDAAASEDDLRQALVRAQRQLAQAKDRNEHLVRATLEGARDAMLALGPVPKVPPPKPDRRTRSDEVALWHLTDWQGGKRTADYDRDVMRTRLMRFCDKAERITEIQRSARPIRRCVVALGGDMVEGLFNFPGQAFEVDATLFGQFTYVSRLIVDVVRRALALYEAVDVVSEWGNHGRVGSKRDNVPPADNIDRMCYHLAREILGPDARLTWPECPTGIQRIEAGAYTALLCHGDEVGRSGFASPTTFQAWGTRQRVAQPQPFRDIYVGHFHRHAQEPLADGVGAIYWTGSPESGNTYALDGMAAAGVPSQRLHFIDPDRGRVTSIHQVWLDA